MEHGAALRRQVLGPGEERRGGPGRGQELGAAQRVRYRQAGSKSWRATPNGNPTSSSPPRARSVQAPRPCATRPTSASSRDLPMPAAPSKSEKRAVRLSLVERLGHQGESALARHQMSRARNRVRLRKSPSHADVF